jgi:hypothetical protein
MDLPLQVLLKPSSVVGAVDAEGHAYQEDNAIKGKADCSIIQEETLNVFLIVEPMKH